MRKQYKISPNTNLQINLSLCWIDSFWKNVAPFTFDKNNFLACTSIYIQNVTILITAFHSIWQTSKSQSLYNEQ